MFRHDVKRQKGEAINVFLHQGGMGDLIMQLPALKCLLTEHSYNTYFIWCHAYGVDLVKKALDHDKVYPIDSVTKHCNLSLIGRSPYSAPTATNLAMHGVDHGFYTLVGNVPTENGPRNYLPLTPCDISALKLPKDYVTVSTGFTSDSREWKPEIVHKVTEAIKFNYGFEVVYLGKTEVRADKNHAIKGQMKADRTNGIDLVDKLSLFESHAVISGSKAILGVDNGLLHLAGMTEVPIVAGFTSVNPKHRLPYRHNELGWNCFTVVPEVACRFCQSNMTLTFNHEFTGCYYKDFACLNQLSSEKWMKALKSALKGDCNAR